MIDEFTPISADRLLPILYIATSSGTYIQTDLDTALSTEAVDAYIAALPWSETTSNETKTMVAGNLRAFAARLREIAQGPWLLWSDLVEAKRQAALETGHLVSGDAPTEVRGLVPNDLRIPAEETLRISTEGPITIIGMDSAKPAKREYTGPPTPPAGWQRVPETGDYFRIVGGELKTITAAELADYEKANHGAFRGLKAQARLDKFYMARAGIDEETFRALTPPPARPTKVVDAEPTAPNV